MKIFDISRALSSGLASWPGDMPFHFELKQKMAEDDYDQAKQAMVEQGHWLYQHTPNWWVATKRFRKKIG